MESGKNVIAEKRLAADLVVVGGGMAGLSAAVAASRNGIKVILVQDRPVLGGNASSELRMWICGAKGGAANRETGLLEELKLFNYYYNPGLNYSLWDGAMYAFAEREPNLTLLLNTSVTGVEMTSKTVIRAVSAWNFTAYTRYTIEGKLFADCSGDSILRLSGAEFRRGRESRNEFQESFAPAEADTKTMGNSILLQLRRCRADRPFRAPEGSYHFTAETLCRSNYIRSEMREENFWWMEFGGLRDTIGDADEIRRELVKIAYGVWEYIKNNHVADAAEWELDWLGALPGKRESVRYVGDLILNQNHVSAGGKFPDVVAHGGWPMDDHHPEAMFTREPPTIFHPAPSPFGIPYRALYSRNIDNLFFAGRNISVTHMALSSTRVMATCSVLGQAIGTAAAIAVKENLTPRGVYQQKLELLQETLLEQDQFLPGVRRKPSALAASAQLSHDSLRSGIDRPEKDQSHTVELAPGEYCEYAFTSPVELASCRMIFDSNLADEKKMRNAASAETEYVPMPEKLVKSYSVSVFTCGHWTEVAADSCNLRRYVRCHFPPVREVTKLRLTIHEAWGGGAAGIYTFEF